MDFFDRNRFLVFGGLFEVGLALAAIAGGWWFGVRPLSYLQGGWLGPLVGVVAALPIFALFLLTFHWPRAGMREIRKLLLRILGRQLAACRWYHLVLLAATAGIGEELLFRGFLQPLAERYTGYWGGAVIANVVFGLAHAVTPTYALAAAGIGGYLSWLLDMTGERNLVVPIVTHAVYDFLAFAVVAREAERGGFAEEEPEPLPLENHG